MLHMGQKLQRASTVWQPCGCHVHPDNTIHVLICDTWVYLYRFHFHKTTSWRPFDRGIFVNVAVQRAMARRAVTTGTTHLCSKKNRNHTHTHSADLNCGIGAIDHH